MRTHKKHGVLLAGVNGCKIYSLENQITLVIKNKSHAVPKEHEKAVMQYVNLRYMPISEQGTITANFLKYISEVAC